MRKKRRPSQKRMSNDGAFKIGAVLLLLGFALASAQLTASADPVTSLEAQALAPGVDTNMFKDPTEISIEELSATLQPSGSSVDTIMRSLGYGGLRDDAKAAASVEAINAGRFRP